MRISDWSSDVCSSDLAPDDFVGTFNTDRFCNSVCKSGYLRHDGNDDGVPAFSIVNPTGSRTALPEPRGLSAARIGVDQPEVELSWPRKSLALLQPSCTRPLPCCSPGEIGRASGRERVGQYV